VPTPAGGSAGSTADREFAFRFDQLYHRGMVKREDIYPNIKEELDRAEELRESLVEKIKPFKYGLYVLIVGTVVSFIVFPPSGFAGILIVLVFFVLYMMKRGKENQKLKERFQQEILPKIIDSMGPEFSYDADGAFEEETLTRSKLFESFNRYHCEDLIRGSVEGRSFRYAEIDLKHKQTGSVGRDDANRSRTVYNGLFAEIGLSESVPSQIVVYPAAVSRVMEMFRKEMATKRVETSNDSFNQTYRVYSDDQDAAASWLSESRLNILLQVTATFKQDGITATDVLYSFLGDSVYVAIPTKGSGGLFNPDLSHPVNTPEFLDPQLGLLNRVNDLASAV
jgi:hypothetical protein